MIKAVIFDLDGVIADTEPFYDNILGDFFAKNDVLIDQKTRRTLTGLTSKKIQNQILVQWWADAGKGPITEEEVDALLEDHMDAFRAGGGVPYAKLKDPDIQSLVAILKERGYKLAIASGSTMKDIERAAHEIELESYMDILVSGEMFKESKPNPEIYNYTVNKLGLKKEECLVVEDSTYGIQAAKAAGLITVAKRDDRFAFDQSHADFMVDRLSQLEEVLGNINR
ncbi:MAG: HAD family phosphatase [Hespellia sp.]|jgi:beta-phosphoglucomutase-like phosphatase (HAD superfamily)|nr:HAD family phosphatase [Hespellia sp.]